MTQLQRSLPFIVALLIAGACSNSEGVKKKAFDSGNAYMAAGKYDEAIVEYRNALQQDERFGEARLRLAEALVASGDLEAALRQFVRAADLMPTNDDAQVRAATLLLMARKFDDARSRIQPVVDRAPTNVNAQILLGNALAGLEDLDGAVRELEEAIKLEPGRGPSYSDLAEVRLAQGNRDQAKAAFEKAVAVDPRSVPAWLALAQFQSSSGDQMAAERSFKRALEVDPKHALANRALAVYYVAANRAPEAEPYLKTLADLGGSAAALQLADYYIATRRSDQAKVVLAPLSKSAASSAAADTRLAAIAYGQNDKTGGHRIIDAVIGREPNNVDALLLKAQFLTREKNLAEAATRAQAAVRANPQSAEAHFVLGSLQEGLGQPKEAIASFNEVLRLNARAAAAQLALSRLSRLAGTPDAAVSFAEGALSNAPGNPRARISLVRGLLARRDLDRAEVELATLLKQFPNAAVVHAVEGGLRLQRRDIPGARAAYERSAALDSALVEAVSGLVSVDLLDGKGPQARARIEARLAADPDRPEWLLLAAQVYGTQRDYAKAETVLRHAIQVAPASSTAYSMLANALLASGKLDAARTEFDQIAQRDANNVGAKTMAAMIVHSQNKRDEAKKRYQNILTIDPNAAVAANNLAWLYAEDRTNLDDALRLAKIAVARLSDDASTAAAQDTLGTIYVKQELPALAVAAFEKSVEKEPDNASYHFHLAEALSKSGDASRARTAVQQALKLKPDYAEAQKLLASLKG